jgi:hypothetical protein
MAASKLNSNLHVAAARQPFSPVAAWQLPVLLYDAASACDAALIW